MKAWTTAGNGCARAFDAENILRLYAVMYQWDYEREIALQIALDYLERTGQAPEFVRAQSAVASAWQAGLRHRIALANAAIKAVEREKQPTD